MVFIHHALGTRLLWMGVDLFFVLSGFLITGILLKEKEKHSFGAYIGHFYSRRAKRILPPYFISLVVFAAVFGITWIKYWYLYFGAMNFLLALRLPTPNSLLWSLAVEEQFYLLWPIAVFYMCRKHLLFLASAMLVAAPLLRFVCTPHFINHWPIYTQLPFRMDTLAAGACLAIVWPDLQTKGVSAANVRKHAALVSVAMFVVAFVSLYFLAKHNLTPDGNTPLGNFAVYEATLFIAAAMFLFTLSDYAKAALSFAPLVYVGRVSYSIYLIHLAILHIVPKGNVLLAAAGSLVYATVMWYLVEKPILTYRGRTNREPEEVVATVKP